MTRQLGCIDDDDHFRWLSGAELLDRADERAETAEQVACGLAFDCGRELGNLELRQVLMDAEMMRNCDERAREEIKRLREEVKLLRTQTLYGVDFGVDSPWSAGMVISEVNRDAHTITVTRPSPLPEHRPPRNPYVKPRRLDGRGR